jgi:cysteine synthase A
VFVDGYRRSTVIEMTKIYDNVLETIGNTPLVKINKITEGLKATVVGKLESRNPSGSVKDRICKAMIDEAEKQGLIKSGTTIIEPTSGNTGIGLAMVAAVRDYKLVLTMPETMSIERQKLFRAYGAQVVLTPGSEGMEGAIRRAEEILADTPNAFMPQQFKNTANPRIHRETTGAEIWADTEGRVDIVVAGVGTGGTITGIAQFIKPLKASFKAIAVEPASSPVLSGGKKGAHRIQGIGAGFVPEILEMELVDEVFKVSDEEAFETAKKATQKEGLLIGLSAGATLFAAIEIAKRAKNEGKLVVAILPDTGERYLSTAPFTEQN